MVMSSGADTVEKGHSAFEALLAVLMSEKFETGMLMQDAPDRDMKNRKKIDELRRDIVDRMNEAGMTEVDVGKEKNEADKTVNAKEDPGITKT